MPLESFNAADEVAILPHLDSASAQVIEIVEVAIADDVSLQLTDGRMYSRQHRWGLTPASRGYLVRATEEHLRVIRERLRHV
jgi:hypothetical protein